MKIATVLFPDYAVRYSEYTVSARMMPRGFGFWKWWTVVIRAAKFNGIQLRCMGREVGESDVFLGSLTTLYLDVQLRCAKYTVL